MSCQCGAPVPQPKEEDTNYAPLEMAFKEPNKNGSFTKFEKLLILSIIIIFYFLYRERIKK